MTNIEQKKRIVGRVKELTNKKNSLKCENDSSQTKKLWEEKNEDNSTKAGRVIDEEEAERIHYNPTKSENNRQNIN